MELFTIRLAKQASTGTQDYAIEDKSGLHISHPDIHVSADVASTNSAVCGDYLCLVTGKVTCDGKVITAADLVARRQSDGTAIYNGLGGHFSAVVVNTRSHTIESVTDKFAVHNIYYYQDADSIFIANRLSALKVLAGSSLRISHQSIFHYIYFHCIPSPDCIYEGVHKQTPATLLTLNNSNSKETSVWRPAFVDGNASAATDKLAESLRSGLSDATQAYADQSDVGAFLSGGLDSSSVVACLANNSSTPVNTFTIGFSEPGYDEKEFAQAVADKYKTHHTVYDVTPDDIFAYLPQIASFYDEPFGNSSALPTFFCAKVAKEHGINTMLAGDGGDELFAGNERYAKQKVFERYFDVPSPMRALLNNTVPGLSKLLPLGVVKKANSYLYQANMGLPDRLQHYNFLHQTPPSQVFDPAFLNGIDTQRPISQLRQRYNEVAGSHAVDNMLYLDWKFTLADNDLMKVNYMTAFAGIDVKYPMLDDRLVEVCCQLPADIKLPGSLLRDFYKKAMANLLPDSTINKSKQGFGLPFGKWLVKNQNLKELAYSSLKSLKKRDLIRPDFIDEAVRLQQDVHAHYYGELVWIMIMLELWLSSHEAA